MSPASAPASSPEREASARPAASGSVAPLLLAAGILLGGNGLQVTLVALRANQEGFSAATIGLFGTTYYLGFVLGCLFATRLILRSGHIRVFAALASIAAIAAVLLVLVIEPWVWMLARAAIGPLAASLVIERFGVAAFFAYTSSLHTGFILVRLFRMARRGAVPAEVKTRFVALLRTSPAIFRLARRRAVAGGRNPNG